MMMETETKKGFSNVIATQNGIITKQSILAGQAQVRVGDTVQKGELLVSGIVDLDRIYVLENAKAEIFARTWRTGHACIPSNHIGKSQIIAEKYCIWLVVGERRIKIFGNSGISYASCDKMKTKLEAALSEELCLPLSIEIETFSEYKSIPGCLNSYLAQHILENYICSAVEDDMVAGEILHARHHLKEDDGVYCLRSTLECHEMIAQSIPAKWNNGELLYDGTNS